MSAPAAHPWGFARAVVGATSPWTSPPSSPWIASPSFEAALEDGPPDGARPVETDPARPVEDPIPIDRWTARIITAGVVVACVVFTWLQLQPNLLLSGAVPAGGDMGAHVWGPAYLRDHLLADFRLTGWSPDWYAGFPAYQFYMVVPALFVVLADTVLSYAVAFKLVSVAGILAMPLAALVMGKLFRLPFPGPALLATATMPFVFDTTFTIYGGNIASTLAGEFAFAISLSLLLVYVGFLARGLETGRHRAVTAVLFALVATCHPIPLLGLASLLTVAILGWHLVRAAASERPGPAVRSTLWWAVSSLGVGSALSAFWILPFVLRGDYLNDMGWERLATDGRSMLMHLLHVGNTSRPWEGWDADLLRTVPVLWGIVVILAVVGAVVSWARREQLGCVLTLAGLGLVLMFRFLPQGRLWNARLLPFFYLVLYFLAALGRAGGGPPGPVDARPGGRRRRGGHGGPDGRRPAVGDAWPAASAPPTAAGSSPALSTKESFVKSWARWNYSGYEGKTTYREYYDVIQTMDRVGRERGCGRALWEYEQTRLNGYGTPMALMLLPHWTDGCIGSMEGLFFEASATTPYHFLMQSMLSARPSRPQRDLPYRNFDIDLGVQQLQLMGIRYYLAFTEQAVEAARAHPDLTEVARAGGDPARQQQLQLGQHRPGPARPDAALGGLRGGRVTAGGAPVVPARGGGRRGSGPGQLAAGGGGLLQQPRSVGHLPGGRRSPRVAPGRRWPTPRRRRCRSTNPSVVTDVETGRERISFRVDADSLRKPVLVKASYFPNWQVEGALGPYRVMPNLMVVVPTSTEVTLSYGDTPVDYLAWALTLFGLGALVVLARRPALRVARPPAETASDEGGRGGDWLDEHRGGTVGWVWAESDQPLTVPARRSPAGPRPARPCARRFASGEPPGHPPTQTPGGRRLRSRNRGPSRATATAGPAADRAPPAPRRRR